MRLMNLVLVLTFLSSCSSVTRIEATDLALERIQTISNPVLPDFKNGHSSPMLVPMASSSVVSYEADLRQWSEVAIEMLHKEFVRQGAKPSASAAAPIEIKVIRASSRTTGVGVVIDVGIQARRGTGAPIEVSGSTWHGNRLRACENAMNVAVELLLNNPRFRTLVSESGAAR